MHNSSSSTNFSSVWHKRTTPNDAARALQKAREQGLWSEDTDALIVHDVALMRERLRDLQHQFPSNTLHALAIKANPLTALLREAVNMGIGMEAASIGEVALAIAAGCAPENIVYDAPAKTKNELRRALELGVHINADNLHELERIDALQKEHVPRTTSTVGLRINPLVGAGSIGMTSVATRGSKFGVPLDEELTPKIKQAYKAYPWLTGVHVHVGSQGCPLEMLVEAAHAISAFREQIHHDCQRTQITTVDIGGGLPTVYRDEDPVYTMQQYVAALREGAPELFEEDVRLVTEFGRVIQAHCGFAIARVEYVKPTGAGILATTHLGADFMLRRVYRPDDWFYRFAILHPDGTPKEIREDELSPISIGGPLCFSGDLVARDIMLPPVEEGDLVFYQDVGGYTLSMWSRYCSRLIPAVVGLDGEALTLLRAQEREEELVQWWS